jgi:hypothetical protein
MIQERAVCTIIAKNYVAFARTLAQSFLSLHPDYKCYFLIIDDFEGHINPPDECFEIVKLTDLKIPDLPGLCFKDETQRRARSSESETRVEKKVRRYVSAVRSRLRRIGL